MKFGRRLGVGTCRAAGCTGKRREDAVRQGTVLVWGVGIFLDGSGGACCSAHIEIACERSNKECLKKMVDMQA